MPGLGTKNTEKPAKWLMDCYRSVKRAQRTQNQSPNSSSKRDSETETIVRVRNMVWMFAVLEKEREGKAEI